MTKISQFRMNKNVESRMFEVFWDTIASLNNPTEVQQFFFELLTPTERDMLAKRFAIALLLSKKYTYKQIIDVLKVSETTIGSVSRWLRYEGKMFHKMTRRILMKEQTDQFWDNLEEFFTFLIPPRVGSNWSEIRMKQYQELKNKRKRKTSL